MTNRESVKKYVTNVTNNSLNFELAKLKHRIQANSSLVSKTNLFIFTRESLMTA